MSGYQLALLLCFLVICCLFIVLYRVKNSWKRRNRKRQTKAYSGEIEAIDLLEKSGFQIEGTQVRRKTGLWVNGDWIDTEVRVDFLARRKGRPCLVEVKTGELAPNPRHGPTRRQLLEYSLLFPDREIYLLDMNLGVAHRIEFPIGDVKEQA